MRGVSAQAEEGKRNSTLLGLDGERNVLCLEIEGEEGLATGGSHRMLKHPPRLPPMWEQLYHEGPQALH